MSQKEIEGFLLAGCGQTSLDMPRFSEMITGALSFTCDFNDNITLGWTATQPYLFLTQINVIS